jgi:hypothetical protein
MKSPWYSFIDDYEKQIPYKPLSVILEAFYWYSMMKCTVDEAFEKSCNDKVLKLME